jgi:plastocyanin
VQLTAPRVALFLVASLLMLPAQQQMIASVTAQTAAPGGQSWQIQVDNLAPPGHNWNFNAFYPDHFQAHSGDTITFTVAKNPDAFHAVELLAPALAPEQGYPGFVFKDEDDDPPPLEAPFFNSKPFFGASPSTLCGRSGNPPCVYTGQSTVALKSGVLVNPPPNGSGTGNPSFSLQLGPDVMPGSYFFICLVHGPSMRGTIDVLPAGQPAAAADALKADADRAYQADLLRLTELDRSIRDPDVITDLVGSRNWTIAAGGGRPDSRLSVNEFGVRNLFIRPNDTVTWTNEGPPIVAHTVTGFGSLPNQPPPLLDPYQPVCGGPDPEQNGETAPDVSYPSDSGRFAPDIWNDCPPWQQEDHLTDYAIASTPTGSSFTGAAITSGLMLPEDFLNGPLGLGLPFVSSYSVRFTRLGTYSYACMIHPGMVGTIEVIPTPTPGLPGS